MGATVHGRLVSAGFDEAAPRWDRHYGADGTMRLRPQRFRAALEEHCPPPADVLDFGCGSGRIAIALAEAGWHVTGCDISSEMLAMARRNYSGQIHWVHLSPDTQRIPFASGTFDAIIASSVLEYVSDPLATITEFARLLRPEGCMLATVPDLRHWKRVLEYPPALLSKIPGAWYITKQLKYRDYVNYLRLSVRRYTPRRWQNIVEAANLCPVSSGACNDPLLLLVARRTAGDAIGPRIATLRSKLQP